MECLIIIKHWNEDGEPYKDIRLYDKRGQALGFGQIKVADTKTEKSDELGLFSDIIEDERCITYEVTLDLKKLAKYIEDEEE